MLKARRLLLEAEGPAESRETVLVVEQEDGLEVVTAHVRLHPVPIVHSCQCISRVRGGGDGGVGGGGGGSGH